jgi:hypothetical protein
MGLRASVGGLVDPAAIGDREGPILSSRRADPAIVVPALGGLASFGLNGATDRCVAEQLRPARGQADRRGGAGLLAIGQVAAGGEQQRRLAGKVLDLHFVGGVAAIARPGELVPAADQPPAIATAFEIGDRNGAALGVIAVAEVILADDQGEAIAAQRREQPRREGEFDLPVVARRRGLARGGLQTVGGSEGWRDIYCRHERRDRGGRRERGEHGKAVQKERSWVEDVVALPAPSSARTAGFLEYFPALRASDARTG